MRRIPHSFGEWFLTSLHVVEVSGRDQSHGNATQLRLFGRAQILRARSQLLGYSCVRCAFAMARALGLLE